MNATIHEDLYSDDVYSHCNVTILRKHHNRIKVNLQPESLGIKWRMHQNVLKMRMWIAKAKNEHK